MSFAFSSLNVLLVCVYSFLSNIYPSIAYLEFSPGDVSPERLEIGIGSSDHITCRMNLTMFGGSNSSSLYFMESDTNRRVPQSDITIINATTIVYALRNSEEQDRRYRCMSGGKGIAEAHIVVGTPPTEVKEFKCRAYNYRYMVCNFTIPHNTLDVKYDLNYYWTSPFRRDIIMPNGKIFHEIIYPKQQYKQICELENISGGKYAICNITKDSGKYHQHYEIYNFTLTGYNSLGKKIQSFAINNFESVIPPRPELNLIEKSTNNASFWWRMETHFYRIKGIKSEIRLRPEKFDWMNLTEHREYKIRRNKSGYTLEIYKLPYAFYKYQLNIRIRVKSKYDDEDLWSEVGVFEFQTNSCRPDAPPKTDVSSFDLIDTTESRVRLYWEQRPFYRENGENFQYFATEIRIDDIPVEMSPVYIDRTSAVFRWNRKHKYDFEIRSYNNEGYSQESSHIVIPAMGSKRSTDYTPDWIRSIYRQSNRTFTLSWNPPFNQTDLVDYTVFWCYSKPAVSNECNDTIQFKHITKNITQYTTESQPLDHTIIFAVSANYLDFTTGLHWTMCTADITIDLIKMDPEIKAISPREILIQWNLERFCTSILEGYNLTICPIEDAENRRCFEDSATTLTIEKSAKNYVIKELKPFTTYKIEMFMFSKMKRGKTSEPQNVTTHEAASSTPRNLKYYNVTASSVWLSWQPPLNKNGILRSYVIKYCTENTRPQCHTSSNSLDLTYKLENLTSYTNYSVHVMAKTIELSEPSEKVYFKTLLGVPSRPQQLKMLDKNGTVLKWEQPDLDSERVDFYEISVKFLKQGIKQEEYVYGVINATKCTITIPACSNKAYQRELRVRSVTAVSRLDDGIDSTFMNTTTTDDSPKAVYFTEDSMLRCYNEISDINEQLIQWHRFHDSNQFIFYKSPWQEGITQFCSVWEAMMVFQYVAAFIVLISCILIFKTIYRRYKRMSDIEARLPSGLDYTLKDNTGERNMINDRDDEFYIRSKEASNESKRLLTIDSGYLGESLDVSAIGVSTPPISIGRSSSGYNGSYPSMDYCRADDFNTRTKNISPIDDAYTLMQVPKYSSNNAEVIPIHHTTLPAALNIMKPNNIQNPREEFVTTSLAGGTALNPFSMSTVNSSGYVETRASQKPVDPAGYVSYTTLEALSRKAPEPPSGYVTPKELLALGQHSFR